MAISTVTEPDTFTAAYRANRIIWEFTSDDADIVKMIADVYIEGSFLRTIEVDPLIGFANKFRFDIAETLQDNLKKDGIDLPDTNATGAVDATESIKQHNLELFEVTQDVNGNLITAHVEGGGGTPDVITSSKESLDIVLNFEDGQDYTTSYHISDASNNKFLTNAPSPKKIQLNETEFLGLSKETTTNSEAKFTFYDFNGNILTSTNEDISGIDSSNRFHMAVGTIYTTTLVDLSLVDYYTVQYINNAATLSSEIRRFNIDRDCHENSQRFHWLNKFGAWDSYTFTGNKIVNESIDFETFESPLGLDFDERDFGIKKHNIQLNEMFTVTSKLLIDTELDWLKELFRSSLVLTELSGSYFPIIIDMNSVDLYETDTGFNQLSMKYIRSNKPISHRN